MGDGIPTEKNMLDGTKKKTLQYFFTLSFAILWLLEDVCDNDRPQCLDIRQATLLTIHKKFNKSDWNKWTLGLMDNVTRVELFLAASV